MNLLKNVAKFVYRSLPYKAQVRVARGNPNLAFYIRTRPRNEVIHYYLNKYAMHINTEIDVERRMLSGFYERDTLNAIRNYVKPGNICLDIGANVGAISIALADAVGAEGKVIAFEPGPDFFSRLKRNVDANPGLQPRLQLQNLALSEEESVLRWQKSDSGSTATTAAYGMNPLAPTIEVQAVRMDDFAPVCALPRIDFVKLDVDGLEYSILKGAQTLLKKHRPIIYTETNMWNEEMKEASRKMEVLLREIGYELYRIDEKTHKIHPTTFPNFSFNTIAIPRNDRQP